MQYPDKCHYCGSTKQPLLVCDYFGYAPPVGSNLHCRNIVCTSCATPQVPGMDITWNTLCKDHAFAQYNSPDGYSQEDFTRIWEEGMRLAEIDDKAKAATTLPVYLL